MRAQVYGIFGMFIMGFLGQGRGRPSYRFGPQADWRIRPLLKNEGHL